MSIPISHWCVVQVDIGNNRNSFWFLSESSDLGQVARQLINAELEMQNKFPNRGVPHFVRIHEQPDVAPLSSAMVEDLCVRLLFGLGPDKPPETQPKSPAPAVSSVMQQQIGGNHYKNVPDGYQPIEIGEKLQLSPMEYSCLKYLLRHRRASGAKDIRKMIHFAAMILEKVYGESFSFEE